MRCQRCGREATEGNFCPVCGSPLMGISPGSRSNFYGPGPSSPFSKPPSCPPPPPPGSWWDRQGQRKKGIRFALAVAIAVALVLLMAVGQIINWQKIKEILQEAMEKEYAWQIPPDEEEPPFIDDFGDFYDFYDFYQEEVPEAPLYQTKMGR